MQLTLHTDYALRVLLYLAHFPDRRAGTAEMSAAYGISKHHLVRVVQTLAAGGFVHVLPGRAGGVELARLPGKIKLGDVVRACEPGFHIVECFDTAHNTCPIVPVCGLIAPLEKALRAFFAELDQYTLADLVKDRSRSRFVELVGR
jgi:Rrf2 family nitric oxide-sensitive transcriptional repressor